MKREEILRKITSLAQNPTRDGLESVWRSSGVGRAPVGWSALLRLLACRTGTWARGRPFMITSRAAGHYVRGLWAAYGPPKRSSEDSG